MRLVKLNRSNGLTLYVQPLYVTSVEEYVGAPDELCGAVVNVTNGSYLVKEKPEDILNLIKENK